MEKIMSNMYNDPDWDKKIEIVKEYGFQYLGDNYGNGAVELYCRGISILTIDELRDFCAKAKVIKEGMDEYNKLKASSERLRLSEEEQS
jgi:hypothetical protein